MLSAKRAVKKGFLILMFGLLLSACAAESGADKKSTANIPAEGTGNISGQVEEAVSMWPDETILIYAAPFYSDESHEEGFYMLETSSQAFDDLDQDGKFVIQNVSPGSYVLVVGPRPEEGLLIVDSDQNSLIAEVIENQTTHLGIIHPAK